MGDVEPDAFASYAASIRRVLAMGETWMSTTSTHCDAGQFRTTLGAGYCPEPSPTPFAVPELRCVRSGIHGRFRFRLPWSSI